MPFHLLAFNSTLAAVAGYQQVSAIADQLYPRVNAGLEFTLPTDAEILVAYAGAAANVRTKLTTPSLVLRGGAQVVPISGTLLPAVDPNVMDLTHDPIKIHREESLRCDMESNSATAGVCLVAVADPSKMKWEIADKDLRWIRATFSVTTVAQAWALGGAITLEDTGLEGGMYAVYGLQAFFATALGVRMVFPGQVERPGCPGQATAVSRSALPFWTPSLGLYGVFDAFYLPQFEVLDTAAATVTYTVWMLCSKLGAK